MSVRLRLLWLLAIAPVGACLFPSLGGLTGDAGLDATSSDGALPDVQSDAPPNAEGGIPPGAAAYYPFEEGSGTVTADKSGSGYNGVLSAHGVTWTTGKIGGALSFSGAADAGGSYVDIPSSVGGALDTTSSFSITAWINASAVPADDAPIVSNTSLVNTGFQFDTTRDTGVRTLGLKLESDAGAISRYSSTILSTGVWYFVAGVYDATTAKLDVYVNGVLDDGILSGAVPASFPKSTVDVNIGRRASLNASACFLGTIDEVRIYESPLTAAQVAAIYAAQ